MTRRLFVVVSTGQAVANLPPVLEHARQADLVQWVESDQASRNRWSAGARTVLQERDLQMVDDVRIEQVNDPGRLAEACRAAIRKMNLDGVEPCIVLNGGNKLTPVGLIQAWADRQPILLYGNDVPAACGTFRGGVESPPEIRSYERHELDLPEILTASGHRMATSPGGGQVLAGGFAA